MIHPRKGEVYLAVEENEVGKKGMEIGKGKEKRRKQGRGEGRVGVWEYGKGGKGREEKREGEERG